MNVYPIFIHGIQIDSFTKISTLGFCPKKKKNTLKHIIFHMGYAIILKCFLLRKLAFSVVILFRQIKLYYSYKYLS